MTPSRSPRASKRWYVTDDGLDAQIRTRFGVAIERARRGALADWAETPEGVLALVILLDQFSRNAYRGTPDAFAGDATALAVAKRVIERGLHQELGLPGRVILYHPFEHSENPDDQERSVVLFETLAAEGASTLARGSRRISCPTPSPTATLLRVSGGFRDRNRILGRANTAEERTYLDRGGGF